MIDFTLNDSTQVEIKKHLAITEILLSRVASKVSGVSKEAIIYALPDLGIASNKMRMFGGFYTGIFAYWDTSNPIIPVDSTINSCGVSVFKLKNHITPQVFVKSLRNAMQSFENKGYVWNFNVGNHFIIMGELSSGEPCVVIHASAQEFKKGNINEGLYPEKGNWFFDDIEVEYFGERFLRFISGKKAEQFFNLTKKVKKFNRERHRIIAELLFKNNIDKEILNIQHYGMPSQNSIAIGCIWEGGIIPLLTAPNQKIYLVEAIKGGENTVIMNNEYTLFPHGLGVYCKTKGNISYYKNDISIFGNNSNNILDISNVSIRCFDSSETELESAIAKITSICPASILDYIKPIYTYSKNEALNEREFVKEKLLWL